MKKLAMLLCVTLVAGCKSSTDPIVESPRPLLEVEYVNYAWSPTYHGVFIDESGQVVSYDRKGAQYAGRNNDTGTVADLYDKYQPDRTVQKQIDVSIVSAKIDQIDRSALTPEQGRCADAGTLSYYAYNYDGTRFTRSLIWRAGDIMQKNTSAAAQELVAYIKSHDLVQPTLSGCEP